jgi:AhpD family alkylhydroperoxidase
MLFAGMLIAGSIPDESSEERQANMEKTMKKRRYSISEAYRITLNAFRSVHDLKRAKRAGDMDKKFMERIMLAVTQVNGCAMCSYYHAKAALESGMSDDEIKNMLGGDGASVPEGERRAVLFAQHYADTRGNPSKQAWESIRSAYGETGARGILAAVRMIMMGNVYGIAWGSFLGRFSGKADARSDLLYELGIMLCSVLYVPAALAHAGVLRLLKKPLLEF